MNWGSTITRPAPGMAGIAMSRLPCSPSPWWQQSGIGRTARRPKKETRDKRPAQLLIRWSVQEIRRIAIRLAQRRIGPAHVIAWSIWRRAHQAEARRAHIKRRAQL